jgi:hypothetical protein
MAGTASAPPPGEVETSPDQIAPGALDELELLPGERISRCWRTGLGFLVMTNLRCIPVWRKAELFSSAEWHTGPTFFFYNLAPPSVFAGRFVVLTQGAGDEATSSRFLVHDPEAVSREIEEARPAGRAEWEARRAREAQELGRPRPAPPPPGTTVIIREIVKVRCSYCGNLMDDTDAVCPACGARQSH